MRILDRAQSRIPQPWRTVIDWLATTAMAVAAVLAFQARWASRTAYPHRAETSWQRIAPSHYFVLGDNRKLLRLVCAGNRSS